MTQLTVTIPDSKLSFFMELTRQLGLKVTKDGATFPALTDKEIIEQAKKAENEIEQGKTLSHADAYAQFKKW